MAESCNINFMRHVLMSSARAPHPREMESPRQRSIFTSSRGKRRGSPLRDHPDSGAIYDPADFKKCPRSDGIEENRSKQRSKPDQKGWLAPASAAADLLALTNASPSPLIARLQQCPQRLSVGIPFFNLFIFWIYSIFIFIK